MLVDSLDTRQLLNVMPENKKQVKQEKYEKDYKKDQKEDNCR